MISKDFSVRLKVFKAEGIALRQVRMCANKEQKDCGAQGVYMHGSSVHGLCHMMGHAEVSCSGAYC